MEKNKDKKALLAMAITASILVLIVVSFAVQSYAGIVPTWKVLLPFGLAFVAILISGSILLLVLKYAGKKSN